MLPIWGYNVNMSAYLILGGNLESRWNKVLEFFVKYRFDSNPSVPSCSPDPSADFDTIILSGPESIGISEIRDLEKSLSLKPYNQPPKIAIIQAELLTYEAQTAMLKTLEEPPGETIFLLYAPNSNLLLPTILSRCQIVQLPAELEIVLSDEELKTNSQRLNELLTTPPIQRLLLADEWGINKDKEQAIRFCQIQLVLWREILLGNIEYRISGIEALSVLKSLTLTLTHLKASVNPKLTIDNFLLGLPDNNLAI
jgi:hypothetical protein